MKKTQRELFKALCSFKSKALNEELLTAATPEVLGQIFYNRMQGAVYGVLKEKGVLKCVNREFRNSLREAYEENLKKNTSYFWSLSYISDILSKCKCNYAMLKGAYLCKAYPDGYRTSNDIDLLVLPTDVTRIGKALKAAGFKQGYISNGAFVPASRKDIIESKMMRGEAVPYIKEIWMPSMRFLEVDINFSLDYKPSASDLLEEMLSSAYDKDYGNFKIRTLKDDDFFVHLCCHLYKEATTLPWVEMKRDMTLYKYMDIYMLLNDMSHEKTDILFEKADKSGCAEICAFAVIETSKLFDFSNNYAVKKANKILKVMPDFIHTVNDPKNKKVYIYSDRSIESRFFNDDRTSLLREVVK